MRKSVLGGLVFMLILGLSTPNLKAVGPISLGLNFGVVTNDNFKFDPFVWSVGAELDLRLGQSLMLSPECLVWIQKFDFDPIYLSPGVLLNVKMGPLFFGGGLVYPIIIGSGGSFSDKFSLKVNAGLKGIGVKLTVYVVTPFDNAFKKGYMAIGATVGFMF